VLSISVFIQLSNLKTKRNHYASSVLGLGLGLFNSWQLWEGGKIKFKLDVILGGNYSFGYNSMGAPFWFDLLKKKCVNIKEET